MKWNYEQTHLLILLRTKLTKPKVKMKRKEKNEKVERLSIEHKAVSPSVQVKLIPVFSRTVVLIVLGCLSSISA